MNKRILIVSVVIFVGLFGAYNLIKYNLFKNIGNNDEVSSEVKKDNKISIKDTQRDIDEVVKTREFDGDVIYNDNFVPVLMYHSIDYEENNELRIPADKFQNHMKYLKDNGYTTLTMDEFYDFMIKNKPVPRKSVLITFDDGYEDNYKNAYPILKKFGFKATIFVITSTVDNDGSYLNSSQLKEMSKNGIDIEGHTVNHDDLSKLDYNAQLKTLKDSKSFLEDILNKEVNYVAYPFGRCNGSTVKAAETAGYKMAFTTEGGWANRNQGIYELHRVYMSNNHDMNEFQRRLTNPDYDASN
ncbi:MAG: polysaccharide deacetylase family protein [Clostridium sp.]|jgi:peptidoglycan/xylan/chitin deacetylase (PgdA/CDA1 family)|uniref:polysaccharide deacetylase family protein n=1 Tax=Clostridium sp. TaxID=1506 RepID=UPI0025C5D264|nr:polysaccharide deacetylase family protein [Clostridium sp.]MCH3965361.1 polysaccharide deacetylase family protein [Clostridium sp.]MCI1714582.1 polysaccharide deacetylase family protein [Clostridium sp.]MCI1798844.1 polysaccharide deacetylase family protein [Clostridium sp.]MCI1812425.1 polysaccharide deacetylase family protein [Clostridium sp.]MCI1869654.1 polysaccharide deacetylase family protein [Clostridium sp.]